MTNLIVIDNQVIIREGIKGIIESNTQMQVRGGGDIFDLMTLVKKHLPEIVLIDIDAAYYSIETIKIVLEIYPNINVLIMAEQMQPHIIKELIAIGVIGFTSKKSKKEQLIKAIECVSKGQPYLSELVAEPILTEFRRLLTAKGSGAFIQLDIRKPLHLLTNRECDVLQSLADGQSNRDMADSLCISDKTVKNHVSNILEKLTVRDRTQAVVKAIKNGWVHLN